MALRVPEVKEKPKAPVQEEQKENPENVALTLEDKSVLLEENEILMNRLTKTDGVENQVVQARIDLNKQRLVLIDNIVRKQEENDLMILMILIYHS